MRIAPLSRHHREAVLDWLNDPAIGEILDVKLPLGMHHLVQRELPVYDRDGVLSMESVFIYEVTDADGLLAGFCLSYAFDDDTPDVRELDYALPGLNKSSPAATYEAMVRIAHAVFSTEKPRELRVYMRNGASVPGHVRVFTRFGWKVVEYAPRKNLRGVHFKLVPDDYYASAIIKRYGITRP
jgi:hypothetical protein